ncbi:protoporphyrinogen/coproporphyrinogen oxidase [Galbitalea soli]|uniref:NAD(P)-binding protein n=1 Tax=Galbitalea soli TaxID=1268042 RepID=A0A7C9PQ21_9MICO|nr:FAD-dependent oxidoreductase [Galbitalea soli]NEM92448.1 NAD(P)-binding protein [Galbitalea soli]NYJ29483.1 oxygen-dependent protoporphyrinogen oxidase [Galbitalea soli]
MADFVVIGGGIGGLVLARRLALNGATVTLVEASDRLGGSVSRHEVAGIVLDAGAESFATRGGTVAALATSLGLGEDLVEPNPDGGWVQPVDRPAFRLPELSLLGIPGAPLARDVIAVIGVRAALRAFADTVLPATYGTKAETVGELVRRRMGDAVVEQLVTPIVRGVYTQSPDELLLTKAAPELRNRMARLGSLAGAVRALRGGSARAGSAVGGIRGGVARLVDALAAELDRFGVEIHLNTRVDSFDEHRAIAGGQRLDGRVIVAAPGMLGDSDPGRRVVLATLVVDVPALDAAPRGTGVLVAPGAPGIHAKALTHASAKWDWVREAAGGRHVLRLSYDDDRDDLAEIARADAEALTGVAIPASAVLGFDRVAWYRPTTHSHTPDGILAVGETIAGTGLAAIIAQAEETASQLALRP